MFQIATITSKRQLTLPSKLFKQMALKEGEKVVLSQEGEGIKVMPALRLVDRLAGSIEIPQKYQGKTLEKIISESKRNYFRKRG